MRNKSDRQCKYEWQTGGRGRCENAVFYKAPGDGWCLGHWTRNIKGYNMEKPFRQAKVTALSPVFLRGPLMELLHEEANKRAITLYGLVNEIVSKRFEGYGTKSWKLIKEYKATESNMEETPQLRVPPEVAVAMKALAETRSRQSLYSLIQDVIEEWAVGKLTGENAPQSARR